MRTKHLLLALVVGATLAGTGALGAAAAGEPAPRAKPALVDQLSRLSLDLRSSRLTLAERSEIAAARTTASDDVLYERYLDKWFQPKTLDPLFPKNDYNAEQFFLDPMAVYKPTADQGTWVHYLPSVTKAAAGEPPCGKDDRVRVVPWWNKNTTITVCKESYQPSTVFDSVGFCAGRTELAVKRSPRPGCACGPLLLACLPPEETHPEYREHIDAELKSETLETGRKILWEGRPYDDVLRTSRTWQSGMVEFFYLRREMLGTISKEKWSPALESKLVTKLKTVDLASPGRWVDRTGVYAESGNFIATPFGQRPTYRNVSAQQLAQYLCVEFKGVNVESDDILEAVKSQHGDLHAFGVKDSPMRSMRGCSGCHAPMDAMSGFLYGLNNPLEGGFPTGTVATGQLYVKGAHDLRGEGTGFSGLMKLIVSQPEFDPCLVRAILRTYLGGQPSAHVFDQYVAQFTRDKKNVRAFARSLLASPMYRQWVDFP